MPPVGAPPRRLDWKQVQRRRARVHLRPSGTDHGDVHGPDAPVPCLCRPGPSLGAAAIAATAPAQAQADAPFRAHGDAADVALRSGMRDDRLGDHGYRERLVIRRDRYGRPVDYRDVPRGSCRAGPPYGNAHGHDRNHGDPVTGPQWVKCNQHRACTAAHDGLRHDHGRDRDVDGRRWRDRC